MTFNVSNSKIKTWRTCRKQYDFKYIRKLVKRRVASPLVRGRVVHEMIEAFISGEDPWRVFKQQKESYKNSFREEREAFDEVMNEIDVLMAGYFDYYKKDPIKYIKHNGIYSEHYFDIELTKGINLIGYIDTIGLKDNFTWLVEHKSHKTLPSDSVKISDIQSCLYAWVMPQVGMPEPDGICWDYIRAKTPTVPKVLKSGELSKGKNIDTTWATYLQAIKDNDLNPKDYKDMKKLLEGREESFYVRKYFPLNKTTLSSIVDDTITTAKEMKRRSGKDCTRNLGKHCDWCDYYNLCQAELRGLDTDFMIKADYKERTSSRENKETKKQHTKKSKKG